jgi:hypothetical protein
LYINDIATQSFSRLFADDTSLLYSSNNINEIECHLQLWENVTPKCLWFSTNFAFSLLKTIQGLLAAWLVYINDIAIQSFSRLFADDTSLLYSSNNINEIEFIVNSDLSKMYNWSKEWLVDFNPKKTESKTDP